MKLHLLFRSTAVVFFVLSSTARAELRAGAAVVDVTPTQYPVLVNGGMLSRSAEQASTPINARALVLDDGRERLGIVVVDSCMMGKSILDEAKELAAQRTQLSPDRILISATHTHSAPSSMGALGTDADADYIPVLRAGLVEALAKAEARLRPARVGWGVGQAPEFTAVRRWIRRPDRVGEDPFGNPTVRATMHAGRNRDEAIGESGPEDPELSLLSIQSPDGTPIAVLANFSMHYFSGVSPLDSDYFGRFCNNLAGRVTGNQAGESEFVAIMSHGCSGDIWRRDYTKPAEQQLPHDDVEEFAAGLAEIAYDVYGSVSYDDDVELAMAEARIGLDYRVPDVQRLEWARRIVEAMGDRQPENTPEVYAREQLLLHEMQSTEVVVQAVRIGEIAIATTPNETYALTGLKIKRQSPLQKTMVIELANGGDGYIPPPEQHLLGGYNTWAARSAGLEVRAEPKIVATALSLLEDVCDQPRREWRQSHGPLAETVLEHEPVAYWRLDEMAGPWARDATEHQRHAVYELPVAFFLEGPRSDAFCRGEEINRAVHIVDGRLRTPLETLNEEYSISLWCWNGMPVDGREVTGWMISQGPGFDAGGVNAFLGLGGTATGPGRLLLELDGPEEQARQVIGKTQLQRWDWNHVAYVCDGKQLQVYLNGHSEPEISAALPGGGQFRGPLIFGGRDDRPEGWEGRLDEIAVFDRALTLAEVRRLAGAEQ